MFSVSRGLGIAAVALTLALASSAEAVITYDDDVTPDILFGAGNSNGGFTVDRQNGVELGIRGKLRFPVPMDVFNSNFDGTYTFLAGVFNGVENPQWSYEWSVNTDYTGSSGDKLSDYSYRLDLDFDPGAGTDFLSWDQISYPTENIPHVPPTMVPGGFYDHSMGTNATGNGLGVEAASMAAYDSNLDLYNVAQNSWRYTFYDGPGYVFDATKIGRYDIRLTVFDGPTEVAQAAIQVKVVKALICTVDSECHDGLACNGAETCNLATNECEFGTEVVCNGQCETGVCQEPSGTCEPVVNGTVCSLTPDACSLDDVCQAGSCVDGGGGDADGDGICANDDNCPSDANPGQEDLDGDGDGDVCDASDATLNVTRARLKRNTSNNPAKPNGVVKVSGDMIVDLPGGGVLSVASGMALRVLDGLGLDTASLVDPPDWTAADCKVRNHPQTGVIRSIQCKSPDKAYVASFRVVNPINPLTPQVYKFTFTLRRLDVAAPFDAPVSATVTQGSVDRAPEESYRSRQPSSRSRRSRKRRSRSWRVSSSARS